MLPLIPLAAAGLFALIAPAAGAADAYKALPAVDVVNTAIDREGASTVLWERFFSNARGRAFEPFLTKVESGDAEWIRVAARLRPASDAGVSLMLDHAMAVALPRSPATVLDRMTSGEGRATFSIGVICSGATFLVDEPKKRVLAWFESSERSLAKVQDVTLDAKRTECVAQLRNGRSAYAARGVTSK